MLEPPSPTKTFLGVSFVLAGFDIDTHRKIRAKLISSGGVDSGQCGPSCTHVIVGKIVYDDPLCVAARGDGKVVVTGLWVDHSYDIGMPVDTSSIMYRPVRDLEGISGAKGMVMCLTGYQRQDREDIMMMVSFMGAQFSKPLVANKVTHLICYKFEGEKYELAKKMKRIKLVNHRWLEDCLRDWEILPEDNYSKSTYELEMMEAEAKDSEEDADSKIVEHPKESVIKRSPCNLRVGMATPSLPTPAGESSKGLNDNGAIKHLSSVFSESMPTRQTRESPGIINTNSQQILGDLNVGLSAAPASTMLNEASDRTPSPAILQKEPPASKNTDAKSSSLSYSRKGPRRISLGMQDGIELGEGYSSKVQSGKVDGGVGNSSSGLEQVRDIFASDNVLIPPTVGDLCAGGLKGKSPDKRKAEATSAHSKSLEINLPINPSSSGALITGNRTPGSEASASTARPLLASTYGLRLDHEEIAPKKIVDWDAVGKDVLFSLGSKWPSPGERQGKSDLPSRHVRSGIDRDRKTAAPASETVPVVGTANTAVPQIDEVKGGEIKLQPLDSSSSRRLEGDIAKCPEDGNPDMLDIEKDKVDANRTSKTTAARKKTLGAKTKLCKSANLKGSIYMTRDASVNKPMSSPVGGEGMTVPSNPSNTNNDKALFPHEDVEILVRENNDNVAQTRDGGEDTAAYMDDETEAPDEDDNVLEERNSGEKSERVEMEVASDADKEKEPTHDTNISSPNVYDNVKKTVDEGKLGPGKAASKDGNVKGRSTKGTKPSLANKKRKVTSTVKDRVDCNGSNMEEQKRPEPNGKDESPSKFGISPEADKENKAVSNADHRVGQSKTQSKKTSMKSEKITINKNDETRETNANSTRVVERRIEPAWFILSGHSPRQRRKEFQQVIRRLKGRFCKDSHQWSYQATHFIVPDPIRRTEKFFAAAASGRWILKTDYLNASSQAGKFLDEVPYEWHRNGLSEDGTINLEAPRKWRLLRERTGHGALYDMHIIIYGECITPPLDTLKRVVKAGDGTILATSPPYNRFLSGGVDFAIVSPGMPRTDIWVQEFFKHEIPCVVSDYLVDYVCKPGYPLEKHVLYNTHAWVEKSFSRLQRKAEEVVVPGSPDDNGGELSCEVCGSTDRGDVMLICGDDSGSAGCGVGTHIDCCDPPLEAVPDEDWFCPRCSKSRSSSSSSGSSMKRKRGGSVLRSK